MVTDPPQDQLLISRMHTLYAQSFLNKDPSIVHTCHTLTHTHLVFKKDSPMSEHTGMSCIVSLQHSCPLHRKHKYPRFNLGRGHVSVNAQNRNSGLVLTDDGKMWPEWKSSSLFVCLAQHRFCKPVSTLKRKPFGSCWSVMIVHSRPSLHEQHRFMRIWTRLSSCFSLCMRCQTLQRSCRTSSGTHWSRRRLSWQ